MDIAGALAGFVDVSSLRSLGKTANAPIIQVHRSALDSMRPGQ